MKIKSTDREGLAVRLETFKAELEKMWAAYWAANYKNLSAPKVELDAGPKYVRVWEVDGTHGGRSAYCFVERTTGNILKPASWRGPAKHARGNVFAEPCVGGCGPHGVAYLS